MRARRPLSWILAVSFALNVGAASSSAGDDELYFATRVFAGSEGPRAESTLGIIGILVAFDRSAPGRVSVDLDTVDGTALAGVDYQPVSTTLVWEDGEEGTREVLVQITDDALFEGNEWLGVRLSNPTGPARLSRRAGRVVIRDDDVEAGSTVALASNASSPVVAEDGTGRSLTAFTSTDETGASRIRAIPNALALNGGGIFNDGGTLLFRGRDGPSVDQLDPVVALSDDGGFSIAFIEQETLFEGGDAAAGAGKGPKITRRVMFGSWRPGDGEVVPVEPLEGDLTRDLWRLVSGPAGAMALFGVDAEGFAAGTIVRALRGVAPGTEGSRESALPESHGGLLGGSRARSEGRSAVFRLSPFPIQDGQSNTFLGGLGGGAGVVDRSWGPIPVGLLLPAVQSARTGSLTGSEMADLIVRRVSWSGQVLEETMSFDFGGAAAAPAVAVSDGGRVALFVRVATGELNGDGFALERIRGVIADAIRIELSTQPADRLASRGTLSNVRELEVRAGGGIELTGRFSILRAVANSAGDLLLGVQRAPAGEAVAGVTEVLGFAFDEDGTQSGPPFVLGEALQGAWDLGLDDADRVRFVSDLGDGTVRARDIATAIGRGACVADQNTLCIAQERFAVSTLWSTPLGADGRGRARPLTADTGTFWFFDEDNVEVLLKVLDACSFNESFWLYAGGLTDVGVRLVVEDTQTGISRREDSDLGQPFAPIRDTSAFASCDPAQVQRLLDEELAALRAWQRQPDLHMAPVRGSSAGTSPCVEGTLCLGSRFEVELDWETVAGGEGVGRPMPLTADAGTFWFFSEDNVEVLVKVLDACAINDRQWVFAAGLTDLGVRLTVRDTQTGEIREYESGTGTPFQPIADTDAFAGC